MKCVPFGPTIVSLSFAMVITGSAQAQDFDLFEPVETTDNQQAAQSRPGRESRVTSTKPDFTLLGTSRIGDRYSVILAHRDGEKVVVTTEPGINSPIANYSEYSLITTIAGTVSIILPPSSPCMGFPESGVRCNENGTIAELTLPNRPAIAASGQQGRAAGFVQAAEPGAVEVVEDPANPFEAMRARALNGNDANPANPENDTGQGSRFVPRRIDPSEVPPGMRVVRTPFGDRLVNQ